MGKSNNTKNLLANSLKQIAVKKTLKNISVQEICNGCDMNRHTFYYHFKDKQDLVNWIYKEEIIKSLLTIDIEKHWSHGTLLILTGLKENKAFYLNALNTEGQNCFTECLFEETLKNFQTVVEKLLKGRDLDSKSYAFITNFYAYSFTYMTIDWIKTGMIDSPEKFTQRLVDVTDKGLLETLNK